MTKAILTAHSNTVIDVVVIPPGHRAKGLWFRRLVGDVRYTVTDLGNGLCLLREYRAGFPWAVSTETLTYTVGGGDTVVLGDVSRNEPYHEE